MNAPLLRSWSSLLPVLLSLLPVLPSLLSVAPCPGASPVQQPQLPPGFEAVRLPGYFDLPVAFTFAPDGTLFVAEKTGRVQVHDGALKQLVPFLDLSEEVNNFADRGLLGLALHPGWLPDGGPSSWVYLLYTVSPVPGEDLAFDAMDQYSFSRLTRYRAVTAAGSVVADEASRQVLLGHQLADGRVPDGIASLRDSHSNGCLCFGEDGSLLVATGEGAASTFPDFGGNDDPGFDAFVHPVTGLLGPIPKDQDSGSFRAQDLRSLAGKVLRLDPETGLGYPSNPFFDGDPASNASRVWALGLRYPFRLGLVPGTGGADPGLGQPGTLLIGDVGWFLWEELDVCRGGENFGWPCRDGPEAGAAFLGYEAPPGPLALPDCATPAAGTLTDPALAWHHDEPAELVPPGVHAGGGFTGSCAVGGLPYAGGPYPPEYEGRAFFADFAADWLRTLELDAQLQPVAVHDFGEALGAVIDLQLHPLTGELYYLALDVDSGAIFRLRYGPNASPVAVAAAAPTSGDAPLAVAFDGSGSSDPDGDEITWTWDFGDGSPPAEGSSPLHVYTAEGLHVARLTVQDSTGLAASAEVPVVVGDPPPSAVILSPAPGQLFTPPEDLPLAGLGIAGDPGLPAGELEFRWRVDLHHGTHVHPGFFLAEGAEALLPAGEHGSPGDVYYYRVELEVTDGGELVGTDHVFVYPADRVADPTGAATTRPIARLLELDPPHPLSAANPDLEVLRDGDEPPVGSFDAGRQLDTYHQGDQGDDDWIGYELGGAAGPEARFTALLFQEGLHYPLGGWWQDLRVEVRQGGGWIEAQGLRVAPPYPLASAGQPFFDGLTYQSYALHFDPVAGDAIRLRGTPGGVAGFISAGELRVRRVADAPPPSPYADLTGEAVFEARLFELEPPVPLGAGNPDPEVLRNGTTPATGSPSAFAQFDTSHGGDQGGWDWIGYSFASARTLARISFQEGLHAPEGGWLESLTVEVRAGPAGAWTPVEGLTSTPPYVPSGSPADSYRPFTLDFEPVLAGAVRVAGAPGGTVGYLSAGELRVYGPALPPGCGVQPYGQEHGGANQLLLESFTPPGLGLPLQLEVSGIQSAGPGLVGLATAAAELPAFGGTLLIDTAAVLAWLPFEVDAEGRAQLAIPLPDAPQLEGASFHAQAFAIDTAAPSWLTLSGGLLLSPCSWGP